MSLFWDSLLQALGLLWHLNQYVLEVIGVSLQISGSATLIALVLGVPLGVFLGLRRFRGRNTIVALMNTGMGLPPVVVGLFVFMFFSRRGPLGFMELLYTRPIMVIAEVIIAAPYIVAITVVAIGSIPRDFRLQAFGLGASRLQGLWLVMREARVALVAAVIAGFGAIISEVGAVMIVGGTSRPPSQTRRAC
ncbi:MAG: ABC transporter permease [Thermoleophilia bacterium]|nr:ABC transporter permease [Thermoleophilia bacterium]